ncbi:MAG: hypothetical protein A3C79_00050 [Candidatus Taylorbacteria bacterium RIFCSPHIGHO2_02_FULL_45_28]|uniref:SGNH hydrolase-type esterase domain-containing protein n=1 Tax=Candidatus Taylorbacteria bacterium RIFCSPHIGHO2_12_FULL_45_16 TaxID=1802315 RepID=A0A1G2MZ34_9BACT|nr:MAG: hypothetical protein A2830_01310 [Candidatus Taylorbacteria bacterium RIFCSPHIGHO2_01_FULL_44_110]OHA25426.1 MAG: hypothetical protein A3C79_00050 [Candidatus Taylorbacteria bacterium RIFCSPHIGHO2_02_FULL_45_28]OHA29094.1 MAG: hypothetical protein A3F51_00520 [Candidatus Taylorbacteria bacterium RIFCSPHIGHO2_12_FULL_45_16]OHA33316.1 MAG: hypothetical protein A3A23_01400 [Candidatus Taylorbacteria bacterium RIFCSPLOWO2_01_FULL_45_59]OHA38932.1 MAG: hypothetical protein A3I98_02620 [Candi
MKKPSSILIFGDSTAWGAWDMEKGGWVNRLWLHVGNRDEDYVEIYNQSISGGNSETILERFEREAEARGAEAIIFQTGGNDASYKGVDGKCWVSEEKFRENIDEIIKRARKITDKIAFMDLKNCDESKTTPVSWVDIYFTNENMRKYGTIMKDVCLKNKIPFIEIDKLDDSDFEDGLHPNAEGHRKIFEQVKRFMVESGWV